MNVTLTPAYGRDYKNRQAVLKDFNEGKDFRISSSYTSKSELLSLGVDSVQIRYNSLTRSVNVKVAV